METATRSDRPAVQPMQPTTRILIGVGLGLTSAVMLILAFPPYNVWPLIFVAYMPMLLADYRVLPHRFAGLGSGIGIGGWLLVYLSMIFGLEASTWFMQAFAVLVGVFAFSGGRANRLFHLRTGYRWFVPFGVVNTVGIEMLRGFVPILATHAFVGHTLHTQPWLIQPASIFGIYGLDAVIMLVGFALALAAFGLFDRRWQWDLPASTVDRRLSARWLAGMGIVAGAWVALSLILLYRGAQRSPHPARRRRAARVCSPGAHGSRYAGRPARGAVQGNARCGGAGRQAGRVARARGGLRPTSRAHR